MGTTMKHLRKFFIHAAFVTVTSILCSGVAQAQPMYANDTLTPGQERYSPNGLYKIDFGCAFHCVSYHLGWTGSQWIVLHAVLAGGSIPYHPYLIMQDDGNLVIYDDTGAQNETNTDGNPGAGSTYRMTVTSSFTTLRTSRFGRCGRPSRNMNDWVENECWHLVAAVTRGYL